MNVEAPESAKMVLLQEAKFKSYYNKLSYALEQYEEVIDKIMPDHGDRCSSRTWRTWSARCSRAW